MKLAFMWLIVAVVLGIIEAVTVDLVAIWFAVGAVFSMIAALLKIPFPWQISVFFVISILALIVFKPFAKKALKVKKVSTNLDSTVGMMGNVIEDITPDGKGRVHVNGLDWKASSEDGFPIEKGSQIVVKSIKGVTVEVEKI